MAGPVIEVRGLYKKFGQSLRSALKYGLIDAARRGVGLDSDSARLRPGEFWALRDVGFEVRPGEALGIMGVNGSGKTTLLRVLNGTYGPDAGRVTMRGRVGALIAAGAGFDPMLTGRENILINGALVGMSPREIRRRFDEIVDFAELREFIDMPVRNYSSGMAVRLGFSVAVAGRPEILLVDEVLAVGDMNFQRKCFERILLKYIKDVIPAGLDSLQFAY
ncbi:MAG: ATP-binding cassette domain-containing protein, partial [Planctomycetota bacterium]